MNLSTLRLYLDEKVESYNRLAFIEDDPIQIPHLFEVKQDIEISALFAATIAWGQRKTILKSAHRLMDLMDRSPYEFVLNHKESDLNAFKGFVHRTFQFADLKYFLSFLKTHYSKHNSLESAFIEGTTMEQRLTNYEKYFTSGEGFEGRTRKHISSPERGSSCKRLNMFLRWMVRKDEGGVDFGIWEKLSMAELICPLDVHVGRIARELGILKRKQDDWKAAIELTDILKKLDPDDPVKYDYALFGMGIEKLKS